MDNINDFIAHIKEHGVQRTNRYQVIMNIPDGVLDKYNSLVGELQSTSAGFDDSTMQEQSEVSTQTDITRVLALMAADVNTPGYNVSAAEMHVGTTRKIAYDKATGDFNITFRCSGDMLEKKLFDSWMKLIFRSDHSVAFYDEYISPAIQVLTLDLDGNVTYQQTMNEAYPSVITELNMNTEEGNAVLTFQVTFTYRKLYNGEEDYSKPKTEYPPVFGGNVETPDKLNEITAKDLPLAPNTQNKALFLVDVYKNIERVKKQIENGTLNTLMGARLINNIIRDIDAAGVETGITNEAKKYASDVIYVLGRFISA